MIIDPTSYMILAGMSIRSGIRKSYLTHNSKTKTRIEWLMDHGYLTTDKDRYMYVTDRGRILQAKMRSVFEYIYGEKEMDAGDRKAVAAFDTQIFRHLEKCQEYAADPVLREKRYRNEMVKRNIAKKLYDDDILGLENTLPIPVTVPKTKLTPGSHEVKKYLKEKGEDKPNEKI